MKRNVRAPKIFSLVANARKSASGKRMIAPRMVNVAVFLIVPRKIGSSASSRKLSNPTNGRSGVIPFHEVSATWNVLAAG